MALSLACAGYSILVKESGLLVLAFVTVAFAIAAWRGSGPRAAALVLLAGAGTLATSAALLALACGGLAPLRDTFARVAAAGTANDYMVKYQSGGPSYYTRGLGLLQPVPMLLGALGAVAVAARAVAMRAAWPAPRARTALATLAAFTIVLGAVALAWPQKNLRFLSPIYAPLDLLAGALLWAGIEGARARLPVAAFRIVAAIVAATLLAAAVIDQQRFVELFIRRGIPDLATPWFTSAR